MAWLLLSNLLFMGFQFRQIQCVRLFAEVKKHLIFVM